MGHGPALPALRPGRARRRGAGRHVRVRGTSPRAVAGAVALVALFTLGAYVLGSVRGLPTREVRKAPLPGSAVVVCDAPATLEEQPRAQLSFARSRSTAPRT